MWFEDYLNMFEATLWLRGDTQRVDPFQTEHGRLNRRKPKQTQASRSMKTLAVGILTEVSITSQRIPKDPKRRIVMDHVYICILYL